MGFRFALITVAAVLASVTMAQYGLPSGLPSPFVWVRGDQGVVLNAGAVTQWNDIRANGAGFDVYETGNAILQQTSPQLNNQPVVRFQGRGQSGQLLLSRTRMIGRPLYIFAVTRMTGIQNDRLVTSDLSNGDTEWFIGYWNGNENCWYYYNTAFHYSGVGAVTTNPTIYTGRGTPSAVQAWKNGAALWNDAGAPNYALRLQLGGLGGVYRQQKADGEIAEVIMFGDDLTTPQRESIHCYLSQRYNIAISGPQCTTYCCQQVTDVCNSIQSRCNVLAAAAVALHDLCIPGGNFCDVYAAANALSGSCTRVYNTCHALNIAC